MPSKSLIDNCQAHPPENPIFSLSRQDLGVAFGLAVMVLILGAWQMVVGVCGVYHDDAIYVITGKALAQGYGYRLLDLPGAPLQTKYPILYPALLSLIWKIWPSFPENLLAMQWLSLLAGAGTVALAYLYLVRFGYASRKVALVSGLFCSSSAFFLYFCTLTLSETPYSLISIAALWAFERQVRLSEAKPGSQILLGLLLALPFLMRIIGLVLVPAALLTLYLRGRRIRWVGLGAAFIVMPWILWMLAGPQWAQNQVNTYYTNYVSWWSSFGLLSITKLFLLNLLYITRSFASISLAILDEMVQHFGILFIGPCILIALITLVGIIRSFPARQILSYYLIGYLCVILVWPWPPQRFIVPILPFLLSFLFRELGQMSQKYRILLNRKLLVTISLIVLLGGNLSSVYQAGKTSRAMGYPYPAPLKEPISWSSYEAIFHWIKNNTQPDDILAAGLDSMVYLYTGRRAIRPFAMNPLALFYFQDTPPWTMDNLLNILRDYQPKYLIQTPMPIFSEEKPFSKLLSEFITKYPERLTPLYVGKDNRFIIYRFEPIKY